MKQRLAILIMVAGVSVALLSLEAQAPPAAPGAPPAAAGRGRGGGAAGGEGAGSTIFGNSCMTCHGGQVANAPSYGAMRVMTSDRVYASLTSGSVKAHAEEVAKLTDAQMKSIAEWVSERRLDGDNEAAKDMPNKCAANPAITAAEISSMPSWNGWSPGLTNNRFQSAKAADLNPAQAGRLQLKWAFAFPSAISMYGQPSIVAGQVFVGADNGWVYSLDQNTGCVHWSFRAQAGVSGAVSIGPMPGSPDRSLAFFGDTLGNAYALGASDGELIWKTHMDDHPLARIRAAVKYYSGRVYVPLASLEEPDSSSPQHVCCTFRGMVVALDAATGKQIWKTYTIPDPATPRKTPAGVSYMGPSGAGVWGPLTLDPKRRAIYLGTGNAFSEPDIGRDDAIMALNMDTGKLLWVHQDEPGDVWHTGCPQGPPMPGLGLPPRSAGRGPARGGRGGAGRGAFGASGRGGGRGNAAARPANYYCPTTTNDPDWDFSAGTILLDLPSGKSLVIAGQKSGMVWAHDADTGNLVWKSDISRGQVVFGGAADHDTGYFAMRGGGVTALRLSDGLEKWTNMITAQESMSGHTGFSAAVSVVPGIVFVAGLDGRVMALSAFDGHQIWAYDTTQEVKTVNGFTAKGGSIGSAGATIAGGMVFVPSGYTGFQGGQGGNLLLAFGPPAP